MSKKQTIFLISINILLILWISVDAFLFHILNTTLVWVLGFFFYLIFAKGRKYKSTGLKVTTIELYLSWVVLSCIYGVFQSGSYWDYKGLIYNSFSLFLPTIVFSLSNGLILQKFIRMYVIYGIPAFIVFALIAPNNVYGYYLALVTLLLLFFKMLSVKHKVILCFTVLLIFLSSLGARSTIVSFGFSILLLITSYIKVLNKKWIFNIVRLFLLIIPFVLFGLAATGIFNIFKLEENSETELKTEITNSDGELQDENLLADTRTFIYEEVINSSITNGYWLFGRSPARGNDTESFTDMNLVEGRSERLRNEVGICNVFTWLGLVGVVLYFLIFLRATFLAINKSNNSITKIIGLYVSFRWFNSWIAEITNFDLINLTIWIAIAMCFSPSFRNMTDSELKLWVKGVTNTKYNLLLMYKIKKTDKKNI